MQINFSSYTIEMVFVKAIIAYVNLITIDRLENDISLQNVKKRYNSGVGLLLN